MRRLILIAVLVLLAASAARAAELYKGQTLYVPAYSHIYSGPKSRPFDLTCTLSIRNTDMSESIRLISVNYYDSKGEIVRRFVDEPVVLGKLATREFIVKLSDQSGGSGANFIVVWRADKAVNAPLVEAVMIGTQGNQGVSFTSRAQPIVVP